MPDAAEPEASPELELPDETREKLRRSMDGISRAVVPIDLKVQNLCVPKTSSADISPWLQRPWPSWNDLWLWVCVSSA